MYCTSTCSISICMLISSCSYPRTHLHLRFSSSFFENLLDILSDSPQYIFKTAVCIYLHKYKDIWIKYLPSCMKTAQVDKIAFLGWFLLFFDSWVPSCYTSLIISCKFFNRLTILGNMRCTVCYLEGWFSAYIYTKTSLNKYLYGCGLHGRHWCFSIRSTSSSQRYIIRPAANQN